MTLRDLVAGRPAMVFDLDGTLADTSPMHARAFAETLAGIGVAGFEYATFAGRRTDDVFRAVLAMNGRMTDAGLIRRLAADKQRRAVALIRATPGLLPGARRFLDLAAAAGKRLALATSASRPGAEASLAANALDGLFEIVVTGDDVACAKPAPDIYRKVVLDMACPARDCLVFEDSQAGYAAARSAGLDTVIVVHGADARPEWAPPDAPVAGFDRLAEAL